MNSFQGVLLSIDTASDLAGVALHRDGSLLAESTWYAYQSHSRDLLPAIDWMLGRQKLDKTQIGAISVCLGPGSYAGMRVGLSTAKALSYALDVPIVGIGRLAADALTVCLASGARTWSLHAAGRAELAWAAYEARGQAMVEYQEPRLGSRDSLLAAIGSGDLVCGEAAAFKDGLAEAVVAQGARVMESPAGRVLSIARLGLERLIRGEVDNADSLVPLYLRAPAIGPQPPR